MRGIRAGAGLLLVPLLLVGCRPAAPDPEQAAQLAALSARLAALETEVAELKAGPRDRGTASASDVTARAAAQNCAIALGRALETFRQGSVGNRYPVTAQVELPSACEGQRVGWTRLDARQYTFTVTNGDGQVLARQSGP